MTVRARRGGGTMVQRGRAAVLHLMRFSVFALIVVLIHRQHVRYQLRQAVSDAAAIDLQQVRKFYPDAVELRGAGPRRGGRAVLDGEGNSLGFVVQTSPDSDQIVGYSGPTNSMIAFDEEGSIIGIEILSSGDTVEHVEDVARDEHFLKSFAGLRWEQAAEHVPADAVSGATLTSLAIGEGIRFRLGGDRPSLRFPHPVTVAEVKQFFPTAVAIRPRKLQPALLDVFDKQRRLGLVLRTSPAGDDVMGYQGPTDTLVAFDADDRVKDVWIRGSFENTEPRNFPQDVNEDYGFEPLFVGMSLWELAALDPKQAGIEGVSGATMTSMSIAYALPKAARASLAIRKPPQKSFVIAWRDVGTAAILAIGLLMTFTQLRRFRWGRIAFQLVLIGYLGFMNGDMISQALFVGWAQSGVPWRLAPGLVLLTAAALAVPLLSKKQTYCHHLCPFGAAQQLVKNRLPWRVALPKRLARLLNLVPLVLLLLVVATAMLHLPINLAGLEPFDAFFFRIAGWATLTVAVVGLVTSLFVPMAYCRFGCPTGGLLNYLRYNARSDRFTRRDAAALLLLAVALALSHPALKDI